MISNSERGVALMLTLSSLLILTTLVVEFAYNTHVTYEMAANERDRLKAYYLARAALNFGRLELSLERRLRAQFAPYLANLQGTGMSSEPLCKLFPFSTDLLKGIASGGLSALLGGEEAPEGAEAPTGEKKTEEEPEEEVEGEGGAFEYGGDFEVSCETEERKINLNAFRTGAPGTQTPSGEENTAASALQAQQYEDQKSLLLALLSQETYQEHFKGPDEVRKAVNAIADWADRDDRVNEAPGLMGGMEDSEYGSADVTYKVKNGKYATVAELLLVSGIGDAVFRKLSPQVTVYGDNKIHLCQAPDEIVRAFLVRTAQTLGGVIRLDDQERWNLALEAVRLACDTPNPQPAQVAQAVAASLGAAAGVAQGLAAQITTVNRFYTLKALGRVADTEVTLVAVIDAENPNPNLWRTLYFRAEE